MNKFCTIVMAMSSLFVGHVIGAQVPQILNYQGRVSVSGTNFDGTGQFQFALVDGMSAAIYWSNGNSAVSLPVASGLYSVLLGDTTATNMAAIPATVFTNGDVRLRVWFDGGLGLEQLTPDRRFTSVGYALMAGNVSDGAITSSKLAAGAVTTVAIANGAVGTGQLANNAITAANIATGGITSLNIASNTITAANMAPGAGVVPSSTLVLSETATNNGLTAAGFAPLVTITTNITSAGTNWTQATSAAQWSPRHFHAAVELNGKMWVLGGDTNNSPGTVSSDVWSSSDGTNWTRATPAATWSPRQNHAVVALNGKMWVLGGSSGGNDVWSSTDGTNWTQATSAAPWSGRYAHAAVTHNGKMWVLGGSSGGNEVWSSSDGTNWTQATAAAAWSPRQWHAAVVLNSQMWVLGGNSAGSPRNDVWSSSDGVSWTQATSAAPWSPRQNHAVVVLNSQMWVLGGSSGGNEVWSSTNGTDWTQAPSPQWGTRFEPTAVAFNNRIWMLGGWSGINRNDVWLSSESAFTTSTSSTMLGPFYLFQKQ